MTSWRDGSWCWSVCWEQTAECICNLKLQPSHSDPQPSLGRRACRVRLQSAIAESRLQLQKISAAIAESRLQLQNLGCNCRISAHPGCNCRMAHCIRRWLGCNSRLQMHLAVSLPKGSWIRMARSCNCRLQMHSAEDLCPRGENAHTSGQCSCAACSILSVLTQCGVPP